MRSWRKPHILAFGLGFASTTLYFVIIHLFTLTTTQLPYEHEITFVPPRIRASEPPPAQRPARIPDPTVLLSYQLMERLNKVIEDWNKHALSLDSKLSTLSHERGCGVVWPAEARAPDWSQKLDGGEGGGGEGEEGEGAGTGLKLYEVNVRCSDTDGQSKDKQQQRMDEDKSLAVQVGLSHSEANGITELVSVEPFLGHGAGPWPSLLARHTAPGPSLGDLISLIYVAPKAPRVGAEISDHVDSALDALLRSLAAQTDSNYELIVTTYADPQDVIKRARQLRIRLGAVIPAGSEGICFFFVCLFVCFLHFSPMVLLDILLLCSRSARIVIIMSCVHVCFV